jgi:hypothetical protein
MASETLGISLKEHVCWTVGGKGVIGDLILLLHFTPTSNVSEKHNKRVHIVIASGKRLWFSRIQHPTDISEKFPENT